MDAQISYWLWLPLRQKGVSSSCRGKCSLRPQNDELQGTGWLLRPYGFHLPGGMPG